MSKWWVVYVSVSFCYMVKGGVELYMVFVYVWLCWYLCCVCNKRCFVVIENYFEVRLDNVRSIWYEYLCGENVSVSRVVFV